MMTAPTLQSLAYYAREHFGEDGYRSEESVPSTFDLVLARHLDAEDGDNTTSVQASTEVWEHLCARAGFAPVSRPAVDVFVQHALTYLRDQFTSDDEARSQSLTLSHIFWGNLVEARLMYGPLRLVACTCGYVMTGRDEDDLFNLVRRHLWGQEEPDRHNRAELPEATRHTRLVSDQDLLVETVGLRELLRRAVVTTVVVLEDEPPVRELLREVLTREGYDTVPVGYAAQLSSLQAEPDLFLVDVMLPEKSGIEVAEELRATGYADTPMIAMSSSRPLLTEARDSGLFQDVMAKPFELGELLERIRQQIARPAGDA